MAIKKPRMSYNKQEYQKLIDREINNYSKLNHPLLPKFIGTTKIENFLVIEFIKGKTLSNIKQFNLRHDEKIKIIWQLMDVLDFLHHKKHIYRDLKPNNVMIDDNKNVVLIDFDRIIDFNDPHRTCESSPNFAAPEIQSENLTFKCDVYSLGQMIYFIINETEPDIIINKFYIKKFTN